MTRRTTADIVALLVDAGAELGTAERIVTALEAAGLKPDRMRSWLTHPQRAYGVTTVPMVIAGREHWPQYPPDRAIQDGWAGAVVEAAEQLAAASDDERFISLNCLCSLDAVRRLTHGDEERAAQVRAVAQLLLNRFRKDITVNEVLQTRLHPRGAPDGTRLVDCLADDRLAPTLAALRDGSLDPRALDRERDLDFYGW